ncbi:MAG: RDD family protein [Acidimicrobiia bacterium]
MAANLWRRVAARIVDVVIVVTAAFVVALVIGAPEPAPAWASVVVLAAVAAYEATATREWGATPGKAWLGLAVTTIAGDRPGWWRGFLRAGLLWGGLSVAFFVVGWGEAVVLAAVVALFAGPVVSRADRRGPHDLAAGTKVVATTTRPVLDQHARDRRRLTGAALVLAAGVTMAVGTFLPWVTRTPANHTSSGWGLLRCDGPRAECSIPRTVLPHGARFDPAPVAAVVVACAVVFVAIGIVGLARRGHGLHRPVDTVELVLGWVAVAAGSLAAARTLDAFDGPLSEMRWGVRVVMLAGLLALAGMIVLTSAARRHDPARRRAGGSAAPEK